MADKFLIDCVGIIRKQGKSVAVEIYEEYKDGLLGLDQFSHVIMSFCFHKHDSPEQRNIHGLFN